MKVILFVRLFHSYVRLRVCFWRCIFHSDLAHSNTHTHTRKGLEMSENIKWCYLWYDQSQRTKPLHPHFFSSWWISFECGPKCVHCVLVYVCMWRCLKNHTHSMHNAHMYETDPYCASIVYAICSQTYGACIYITHFIVTVVTLWTLNGWTFWNGSDDDCSVTAAMAVPTTIDRSFSIINYLTLDLTCI